MHKERRHNGTTETDTGRIPAGENRHQQVRHTRRQPQGWRGGVQNRGAVRLQRYAAQCALPRAGQYGSAGEPADGERDWLSLRANSRIGRSHEARRQHSDSCVHTHTVCVALLWNHAGCHTYQNGRDAPQPIHSSTDVFSGSNQAGLYHQSIRN